MDHNVSINLIIDITILYSKIYHVYADIFIWSYKKYLVR